MPSSIHNAIVELLEAHPEALEYLLTLHGTPPLGRLVPTTGTRTKTFTIERRVDRAFVVGSPEAPRSFALAEVQLRVDDRKRFSWALYVELGRSRYRCEGGLIVLTFSGRVRRWIADVIIPPSGTHGTSRQLRPTVLAVDEIPPHLLLRPDMPYLVQLAVAAHAHGQEAPSIAEQAVEITIERLPPHLASEQLDAILGMVDAALRARLEERVMVRHEYKSELLRSLYRQASEQAKADVKAEVKAEVKEEVKAEVKAEVKEEVKAEVKEEAMAEGMAASILTVLQARGIPVSSATRKQILACTDADMLDAWLRRAAVASTAAAVLGAAKAKRTAAKQSSPRATSGNRSRAKRSAAHPAKRPASRGAKRPATRSTRSRPA